MGPKKLLLCSLFLLFCFFPFLACKCVAETLCIPEQQSLLLNLKNGFKGDPVPSWESGSNCCNWEGVTCDLDSGHVIGLDLNNHSISGNISSSLLNLTSLRTLNLAYNDFGGVPIPPLEALANLTRLNLSAAGFHGQIPIGISRLTRLVSLDLSFNFLNTPNLHTLVKDLANLQELHLDLIDLSQDLNWIRKLSTSLPRLQVLSLRGCNLRGILTEDLFCIKNLMVLDLSDNDMLSGVLPELLPNNTLESLALSFTNICGNLPDSIGNLKKLTILEIVGTRMTGSLPSSIENLSQLVSLELSYNNFIGVIPFSIGNLSRLEYLDLSYNHFTGVIPLTVSKMVHLQHMDLSNNHFTGGIPLTASKMVPLQHLDLSHNHFTGGIPLTVAKMVHLQHLDLSWNNFEGVIPSSIGNLTQLVYLSLDFNNLNGMVPSSLGKIAKLYTLDLSNNHLSGPLPSFVPNASITQLFLSNNSFEGPWPSSSSGFLYLSELDLRFNSIRGPIPSYLFCLPALQKVYLAHNQLSGQVGECIDASSSIEFIDLSYNQLQGPLPKSLFKLIGLQSLFLESNNFSAELGMFESLKNLTHLDLSGGSLIDVDGYNSPSFPKLHSLRFASCNLTKLPDFLRYQETIFDLDISNNRIGGPIPDWIWSIGNGSIMSLNLSCNIFTHAEGLGNVSFSSLRSLDLHSNMLQGPIPLPALSEYEVFLDYSHNSFSSIIPSNLSSLFGRVDTLLLPGNHLTGNIPSSICNIGTISVILDLSDNNLSGPIPACLFDGYGLFSALNLRGNQLEGTIPPNINGCTLLQTIILSDNHLEGRIPRSLANCTGLQVLDLGNNRLIDSFPLWLGNLVDLRVLILRANAFYGHLGSTNSDKVNCTFSKLQILDLSFNHFSGYLSSEFLSSLKVMKNSSLLTYTTAGISDANGTAMYQYTISVTSKGQKSIMVNLLTIFLGIDLSDNYFEGEIPEAIGELQGLQVLNFSHNAFTGKIPRSIGNLKQLESLDLSTNSLSGQIPQEMTSLTFLSFLNISNNALVGSIPQGNQFSTFPNASFEGNRGLCGNPLSKKCGEESKNRTDVPTLGSDNSPSSYVIGLALSIGLGFGFGIAVVLVLQNVPWKYWKKKFFDG